MAQKQKRAFVSGNIIQKKSWIKVVSAFTLAKLILIAIFLFNILRDIICYMVNTVLISDEVLAVSVLNTKSITLATACYNKMMQNNFFVLNNMHPQSYTLKHID